MCLDGSEPDIMITRAILSQFILRLQTAKTSFGGEMEDIDTELARRDQSWGGKMSEINYRMKKTLQVDKLKKYFITQSSHQNNVIR